MNISRLLRYALAWLLVGVGIVCYGLGILVFVVWALQRITGSDAFIGFLFFLASGVACIMLAEEVAPRPLQESVSE